MRTKFYICSFTRSWDIRGTLKIMGRDQGHTHFSEKIIKGICLDYPCEYAQQVLRS